MKHQKYFKGNVFIHWITALLILILFPLGKYVESLDSYDKLFMLKTHVILGIIVFILTIFRTLFFFTKARPTKISTGKVWNDILLVWVHRFFYLLLFGISIFGIWGLIASGYGAAISNNDPSLVLEHNEFSPLEAHETLATLLMILFGLHVIGVIKHYFLSKENIFKRMCIK